MGGVFSSPAPPSPPPPEPEPENTEAEERKARLEAIARRRRGRQGTIETSPAGALRKASPFQSGKTRLGE